MNTPHHQGNFPSVALPQHHEDVLAVVLPPRCTVEQPAAVWLDTAGIMLLARVLSEQLVRAGVEIKTGGAGVGAHMGGLSGGVILFKLASGARRAAGLRVLVGEVTRLEPGGSGHVLAAAGVGYYDEAENFWRCVHPIPWPFDFHARITHALETHEADAAARLKVLLQFMPPIWPGSTPPPPAALA